jgi:poly(3-hydroxybutyrate) depolymerase
MAPVVGDPIPLPVPVGCVTDVSPGVHDFACDTTIDTVSIPEQCTKTACGVIIDVHGGMMSSQMEDKNTELRALGSQYGYIVIQPNALQNPLLLNQRLFVADTPTVPADDTRVMDILNDVIQALHADTNRVHMTGFSEGGYMTWRWLCEHSELLASVAPAAAAWGCAVLANAGLTPPEIGCEMTGSSVPARNIPVLYMQGMQDGLVDPTCADTWVRERALTALHVDAGTVIAGDPAFETAQYVRTRYLDPDGVPFEYIQHQYSTDSAFLGVGIVGHCYPGSTDLTVTPPAQTVIPPDQLMAFGCKDRCEFTWGQEVVRFFMAHPKQ